jgi:pimeloyl-ACP methyl ester carboxylesterase
MSIAEPAMAQRSTVVTQTHVTAPTRFVEANGIRFAHRKFGTKTGTPLVLLQHFRGGLDHWDPAVTDGLAADRPVILFNNAGVASSSGETPDTIDAMARHAADFVSALGLTEVDLFGFSIGGYVAQSLALQNPKLVRRLLLAGTGPRGGEPPQDPSVPQYATSTDLRTGESPLEAFLYLFFSRLNAAKPREGRFGNVGTFAGTTSIHQAQPRRWRHNWTQSKIGGKKASGSRS